MQVSGIERLFRDHAAQVLAYALRRTDPATAEDVVAEVFSTAWRRSDRIPADEPLLWLYGVARRVLANQHRSLRRRRALELALRALTSDRTETPQEDRVRAALAGMKAADREVLLLTFWEDLDAAQIAGLLGCSVSAVHTRLHRARQRFAERLKLQSGLTELTEVNAR